MASIHDFARSVACFSVLVAAPSAYAQDSAGADARGTAGEASSTGSEKHEDYRDKVADKMSNQDWWPNQLDLSILHQNSLKSNPMGAGFDYAEEFAKLDLDALKKDIEEVLTTSQDWWPADYGHYGPLMIRHRLAQRRHVPRRRMVAVVRRPTARIRFAPLGSWPDNGNLDKARRLALAHQEEVRTARSPGPTSWCSWATVALESMGFKTFGFAGGRADVWAPQELDINWGPEGRVARRTSATPATANSKVRSQQRRWV